MNGGESVLVAEQALPSKGPELDMLSELDSITFVPSLN